MTAQVIFLNTFYDPGPEKRAELRRLQDYITGARNGMRNRIASYHPYNKMIEVQKFHNYFKSKIFALKKCE